MANRFMMMDDDGLHLILLALELELETQYPARHPRTKMRDGFLRLYEEAQQMQMQRGSNRVRPEFNQPIDPEFTRLSAAAQAIINREIAKENT